MALAGIALGGDTGKGVSLLLNQLFVGSFLPLARHRVRSRAREQTQAGENRQGGTDTDGSVQGDLLAFTRRRQGAGAVGTEGDPVGYL